MTRLNERQRSWYVETHGDFCPYCLGTDNRGSGRPRYEDGEILYDIVCENCGKERTEIYALASVFIKGEFDNDN